MHSLIHFLKKTTAIGVVALSFSFCGISYASAETATGNYLAARHAQHIKDWKSASTFLDKTISLGSAEQNLLDSHFLLAIGSGDFEKAYEFIDENGQLSDEIRPLQDTLIALKQIKQGHFPEALAILNQLPKSGINHYVKTLISAWIYADMNDLVGAEQSLKQLPDLENGMPNPLISITEGFIHEYSGKMESAKTFYEKASEEMMTLRSALSIAEFYERANEFEKAEEIYQQLASLKPLLDGAKNGLERIELQQAKAFDIRSIEDGISKSLFDLASFLYEQKGYESALIYARISDYLSPDNGESLFMFGDIMTVYGNYNDAVRYYSKIKKESPNYTSANIRLAEAFEKNNDIQSAKNIIISLLEIWPNDKILLTHLGDIERRSGKAAEAITSYNKALAASEITNDDWSIFYARAMSHDINGDWHSMETDLKKALELNPEHPLVLNYLGYSWVNKDIHLDKALAMIEKAMILKPSNGQIMDSYGWALYKVGQYEKAVEVLEEALALIPQDSTLNDHLGDAYWQMGREIEARYQWEKSINLSKSATHIVSMRVKLKDGIALESRRQKSTAQDMTQ